MKIINIALICLLLLGCDSTEQEVIVVPKDYTGYVLIIFNQKDGKPVRYEDNKRVYEIPESGILKTQFKGNYGNVGFGEYYSGKIDDKHKIPAVMTLNEASNNVVVGFRGGNGTVKRSSSSIEEVEFSEFYIGTKTKIEQSQKQAENVDILKLSE